LEYFYTKIIKGIQHLEEPLDSSRKGYKMLEFIMNFIKDIGIYGLLLSLAIEASSLPFPGTIVVLTYGYIMDASAFKLLWVALLAGAVYTAASYIPYCIGYKLEGKMKKWIKPEKLDKSERWFKRCGEWTIAISRPLGLGNYISYFSGISQVKPIRFGAITYLGMTPWIYVMLLLGGMGNIESMKNLFSSVQQYILIGIGIIVIAYFAFKRYKKSKNQTCDTGIKKTKKKLPQQQLNYSQKEEA